MQSTEIADVVRRMGGVVRGRVLSGRNVTAKSLARAVHGGNLVRLRHGVYAVPDAAPDVCDAAVHGGEVACASALRSHGVWVWEVQSRSHVWVGPNGRVHHSGCRCVTHREAGTSAFGVVSIVDALVHVARCLGSESFFAAFESAWRQGRLTGADRAEVRTRLRAGQRWLVDFARPDADSGLESLLRLRLHRLGLTLATQVPICGVGFVDFVLEECIILEVDGRENHDGASKRHKDLVRDAVAAAMGYETLRFDYALVVHDWPKVEAAILGRLRVLRRRRVGSVAR